MRDFRDMARPAATSAAQVDEVVAYLEKSARELA
jgi:hypothetical protein